MPPRTPRERHGRQARRVGTAHRGYTATTFARKPPRRQDARDAKSQVGHCAPRIQLGTRADRPPFQGGLTGGSQPADTVGQRIAESASHHGHLSFCSFHFAFAASTLPQAPPWKVGEQPATCAGSLAPGAASAASRGAPAGAGCVNGQRSGPVSRILYPPKRRVAAIHLGLPLPAGSCTLPGAGSEPGRLIAPYSGLLAVGFTLPRPSPAARCALTAPFHPCL